MRESLTSLWLLLARAPTMLDVGWSESEASTPLLGYPIYNMRRTMRGVKRTDTGEAGDDYIAYHNWAQGLDVSTTIASRRTTV